MLTAKKLSLSCAGLLCLIFFALILSLKIGAVSLNWQDVFSFQSDIVNQLRLPRILLALLVGAGLSLSGAVFQALLRNPLADPFVLGVSSGSAVGATLSIILGLTMLQPIFSFAGALATILVVLSVSKSFNQHSLILTGVILNFFLASLLTLLLAIASPYQLSNAYLWLLGSLSYQSLESLVKILPIFAILFTFIFFTSGKLNILVLGEEDAASLGLSSKKWSFIFFITTSLLVALVVSISGIIGFVGLMIPHACRSLFGSDYRILVPTSALMGSLFLLISDTLARTVLLPAEIPVGVITALLGTPLFIYFLKKGYELHST